jgi:hypothetical protein
LFPNIVVDAREQLDEDWNSTVFNDDLGIVRCSGGDVGEGPASGKREVIKLFELSNSDLIAYRK